VAIGDEQLSGKDLPVQWPEGFAKPRLKRRSKFAVEVVGFFWTTWIFDCPQSQFM